MRGKERGKLEEGQRKINTEEKGNGKRVVFKDIDKEKKEGERRISDQNEFGGKEAIEQYKKEVGGAIKEGDKKTTE